MTRTEILEWLTELAVAQRGGATRLRATAELLEDSDVCLVQQGQADGLEISARTIEELVERERAS